MGPNLSKKNIVADSMVEDDSESYNLVNIHAPTANLGFSIVGGLVLAMGLYKLYRYFMRGTWCKSRGGSGGETKGTAHHPPPLTTSVDLTGNAGLDLWNQAGQVYPIPRAVYGGGDARNAYWQMKEDRCGDCIEDSRLESAWRPDEYRRSKGRFAQEAQDAGQLRGAGGRDRAWRRQRSRSPSPVKRARSVESF